MSNSLLKIILNVNIQQLVQKTMTKVFEKIALKNDINNESKKNLFTNSSSLFFAVRFIVFNKFIVAAFATFIVEENIR